MKAANLVNDCFPEPPTPTSKMFPDGELITLVILSKWLRASSKMTRFIFFEAFFSL